MTDCTCERTLRDNIARDIERLVLRLTSLDDYTEAVRDAAKVARGEDA